MSGHYEQHHMCQCSLTRMLGSFFPTVSELNICFCQMSLKFICEIIFLSLVMLSESMYVFVTRRALEIRLVRSFAC